MVPNNTREEETIRNNNSKKTSIHEAGKFFLSRGAKSIFSGNSNVLILLQTRFLFHLWYAYYSNSGQFSYPLPNMVHPLDTIKVEGSVRTGAGNCPEFAYYSLLQCPSQKITFGADTVNVQILILFVLFIKIVFLYTLSY
jgi:hypothetical protein